MGLSFLTPAFFIGLGALAIPILIHLTHREKREIIDFPSLMFLHKIPYRSVRRQRIRQWLLFLLRSLALVLLVAAFTRPYWERAGSAAAPVDGARELVILLDRSYSMGYADRWERALDGARASIDSLGPNERATLVAFSDRAEALHQPTSDRAQLKAHLDGVRVGSGGTRYGPALKLAAKLLEESSLRRREVVLITDFQKTGWEGEEDVALPQGTRLTWVDLSAPETSNLSVTSVILEREYESGREKVVASARLTNKGAKPFHDVAVELELGGRRIQVKRVDLVPSSSATVSFDPFTVPEGISRGVVRIGEDSLIPDNSYYFVIWPGQSLSVLVLESGAGRGESLYLRRALSIGDRPSFDVESKALARLDGADLRGRSLVILNDTAAPGERAGRHLRQFVEQGGGLLIVLGESSGQAGWTGPAAELLPGTWGGPVDRSADWGGTLSYINYSHEVFELFNAPHSGDFSTAKFFRYRPLTLEPEARVLARFDDGVVSLAEKKVGQGRVLVWTSTVDTFWNDLALQPVFLPFLHQVTKYACGYAEAQHWHTVGDVLDIARFLEVAAGSLSLPADFVDKTATAEMVALAPSGERSLISQEQERYLLPLEEQGFYDLRFPGSDPAAVVSLAVNLDVTESDLSTLDPEELEAAVVLRGETTVAASWEWTQEEQERTQGMWWILLAGAFVFLAAETVVSNRLSRLAR